MALTFNGPDSGEEDDPNPFLDFRMRVSFTGPAGQGFTRPGFFAGDGQGGTSGSKWRVRFTPTSAGRWDYSVEFERGTRLATELGTSGVSVTPPDGESGSFDVGSSDKFGRDFRARNRGIVSNEGGHYLTFSGSGEPFVKAGMNIPENFLAYSDFDGAASGSKTYSTHRSDWNDGDPEWGDGLGHGIIGAVNYMAEKGANAQYFLPMNVGGDGDDVWPHPTKSSTKTRYDISRLRQWNVVFEHMQSKGIMLHFQLAETEAENETYYDDGSFGTQRKLFFRELIARFGHHPAIEWNIGEENEWGTPLRKDMAAWINRVQAYDHPVTSHPFAYLHPDEPQFCSSCGLTDMYDGLLGDEGFDMTSFQIAADTPTLAGTVRHYRTESNRLGHPWVVSVDEPATIENDVADTVSGHPHGRIDKMWPVFLNGGGGFEWYLQKGGGGHSLDYTTDDYTQFENVMRWSAYAVEFLERLPLDRMEPVPSVTSTGHALAVRNIAYAIYCPDGPVGETVDLPGGRWSVEYYNPSNGMWDNPRTVSGGSGTLLPDASFGGDAAVKITRY